MSRRVVATIGVLATSAMFVVAACGDDYAESSATGPREGTFDGACYRNNTCDDGLACLVVEGQARCRDAGSDGGRDSAANDVGLPSDGGLDPPTPPTLDAGDCPLNATSFPCPNSVGIRRIACHGGNDQVPRCEVDVCPNGRAPWACHSAADCVGDSKCCLGRRNEKSSSSCSVGELSLGLPLPATTCDTACGSDRTQLCRTSSECGNNRVCRPYRVEASAVSLDTYLLGVCD